MDWTKIAAVGMAVSAALIVALVVFVAWACCKVGGDMDAISEMEARLRGDL